MKTIALLSLLMLTACASDSALSDNQAFLCGSGQDLEIRAGLDKGNEAGQFAGEVRYLVEIANNSNEDVTVKSIRISPKSDNASATFADAYQTFDQTVEEGKDHVFEIPANAVGLRSGAGRPLSGTRLDFLVMVNLSNGDVYRCPFRT
jgi:hypothetical protein